MGNNPELKFPLQADGYKVFDTEAILCHITSAGGHQDDEPISAELVRLANLAHEAEAALELALQGMFHANGCDMNPANVKEHLSEARCSCGTTEAADRMAAIIRKYNSNEVTNG